MKLNLRIVASLLYVPHLVAGIQAPKPSVALRDEDRGDVSGESPREEFLRTRPHRQLLPLSVDGLIHLWTADSSNANDVVGSAAGTLGSTTKFVAGRNGLAFEFDGTANSVVSLPVNINPSVFPKLTMGFWVKLRTIEDSRNAWGLTNDNGLFDRAVILDDNRFNGVAGGVGSTYASTLPRITVNEWHCVAVAYDETANSATVYYDGQTQTRSTVLGTGTSTTSLGGNANFATDYVDGQIDEVFMFDKFLAAAQIGTVCNELADPNRGPVQPTPTPPPPTPCNGLLLFGVCVCFSGHSLVQVKDVGTIRMDQLRIGDEVLTAGGSYSKVYSFGHFSPKTRTEFLQVRAAGMDKNHPLEISLEHLIYIQDTAMKTTRLVSAGELKVGDYLVTETGLSSEILSIHSVQRVGAYSPLTTSGQLAVNGVLASSYVSRGWLKEWPISGDTLHAFQHGATLPVRLFCSMVGCEQEAYDKTTGFSAWVQFWFMVEQWQLGLPPVARSLLLAILAAPAFLIMLLGKVHSMPMHFKVVHFIVAVVGYLVLKYNKRTKTPKTDYVSALKA